ncbi:MAG: hypothetical protein IPQ25_15035 [Chitinophagaceae bacterium]|jgi:hypothetical protein|nr:hypothetical protein [Chitinophagaceae bacterium]HQV61140.1 hypothetical protein [Chitinophagaceae bacterium]HQV86167.1 hypothetical protein [Chitinophagaceae bacterium]HQX73402.1 hypothetical protein [Chitinophagaceae bacterium]HQZ75726.1 hypothetical protein [Chitinophagaceae bacterium]
MKYSLFVLIVLVVIATACNKDKFTTEPQVEVKSITPETVFNGNIINLKAKYTDDEGDLDSAYVVYKWYNGATVVKADTFRYPYSILNLPSDLRRADIEVTFEYNTNNNPDLVPLPGVSVRDTTATFGLILIDKARHRSNYSESQPIRMKKP